MDINVTKNGDVVKLNIAGEFNIYSAIESKARLIELLHECQVMEIDLDGVLEIDTSGVQLLLLVKREAQALGKELRLSGYSGVAGAALDLYKLKDFFCVS